MMFKLFLFLIFIVFGSCASDLYKGEVNLDDIPNEVTTKKHKSGKQQSSNLFVNETSKYGLSGIAASTLNIVDLNYDGFSDLVILPSFYSLPEFYIYLPKEQKFKKINSLLVKPERFSFMLFHDFNKDGIIDMLGGVLNQENELSKKPLQIYFGELGHGETVFFKAVKSLKTVAPVASIGLIDVNLDGFTDLYLGNWFQKYKDTKIPVSDQLLLWSDGEYLDVTKEYLLGEKDTNLSGSMNINATPTYGVQICDIDSNGYPDILTTSTNRFHNKMWMNQYKFRDKRRYFKDYGLESGFAGDPDGLINKQGSGRSFGLACADYNNDTIMDIYLGELSHNYDDQSVDRSSLLTGRSLKFPPRFYRTEYFLDSFDINWHQADRRGIWVDLNNDGLLDLIIDNSGYPPQSKMLVFLQEKDHSFTEKGLELGLNFTNPISTVVLDINKDGKMDILTARSRIRDERLVSEVFLFENNFKNKNKSIRLYLKGQRSNSQGLNATVIVKVKTESGTQIRKQVVSYSYGAFTPQNEEGILFGFAEGETPLSLTVVWPYHSNENASQASMEKTYKIPINWEKDKFFDLFESGVIKKHDKL